MIGINLAKKLILGQFPQGIEALALQPKNKLFPEKTIRKRGESSDSMIFMSSEVVCRYVAFWIPQMMTSPEACARRLIELVNIETLGQT
jgi:hypothetical protein